MINFLVCVVFWESKHYNFSFLDFGSTILYFFCWLFLPLICNFCFYCESNQTVILDQSLFSVLCVFSPNKHYYTEEVCVGEVSVQASFFLSPCLCILTPRSRSLRVQQRGVHPGGLAWHSGNSAEQEEGRPFEGWKIWNWLQFCLSYNRCGIWLSSLEIHSYFSLCFVCYWVNFRDDIECWWNFSVSCVFSSYLGNHSKSSSCDAKVNVIISGGINVV